MCAVHSVSVAVGGDGADLVKPVAAGCVCCRWRAPTFEPSPVDLTAWAAISPPATTSASVVRRVTSPRGSSSRLLRGSAPRYAWARRDASSLGWRCLLESANRHGSCTSAAQAGLGRLHDSNPAPRRGPNGQRRGRGHARHVSRQRCPRECHPRACGGDCKNPQIRATCGFFLWLAETRGFGP
jgi:hypothetical protein